MLPSVRSRLPSGRCTADIVAASSRQYEAPVMPHSVITSVPTAGIPSIQAVPGTKPARRADPGPPPDPGGAFATVGCVLGEVTRMPSVRDLLDADGPWQDRRRR